MTDTPKLGITKVDGGQSQKHVPVNEAFVAFDALVQLNVIDKDLTAAPGSPAEGATYIVAPAATGVWAGHDNKIAYYDGSGWIMLTPTAGWLAYVVDEDIPYRFNGTWGSLAGLIGTAYLPTAGGTMTGDLVIDKSTALINLIDDGGNTLEMLADNNTAVIRIDEGDNITGATLNIRVKAATKMSINEHGVGIGGADADATNVLSINGTNVLMNSTASIDLKYNKNAAGDDASMTFQTAFAPKALMGLLGNNNFAIKVGAAFTTAVEIDETTGQVDLPATPHLKQFVEHVSGAWLLDPNEHSGWSTRGVVVEANNADLGDVGANYSRTAGGFMYPFDVKVLGFKAKHRNNNALAHAWGWRFGYHTWTGGSNTVTTTNLLQEVADNGGVGPRDYLSAVNQETDLDWSANGWTMPAGAVFTVGVEAPTAELTNYYVEVMAGYLLFERV